LRKVNRILTRLSLRLSEGSPDLPFVLVDRLYGVEGCQRAITGYANPLAICQTHGPFEGRT